MVKRSDKVSEAIHKVISELLIKGIKDPRIGFVTITGVKVTTDLRQATVYFTVIGSEQEKKNTEAGLNSARGFIRKELGQALKLRVTPDVLFKYDTSVEYGQHIESLLKEIGATDDDGKDAGGNS
ncbi:ribosome-binding factor A [Geomonas silvestris]|uniref:Ribosome-binding factor A n=1 Tax=Geomonas silvestris TaxID=2740184 RepID=A0A6V8MHI0_9BACT|nr:ribosome-binding factor A [Geomonas silvestris]GFO59450.1 ribosome-binding factor A [Geomonas silvestris]